IGAGDYCNRRQDPDGAVALLEGIKVPMILVPGNNESEDEVRQAAPKNATVLHGQQVDLDGLSIFGLGYAVPVTPFIEWSCDLSEEAAGAILERCTQTDILISHSPPKGVLDRASNGMSLGSVTVLDTIKRVQPKLVLCGHIHDCWGQSANIGESRVVNLGPTVNWFEFD
ncbi:metallophosphoesterase, partial [Roseobacter sp.]|uniref:metallophosphoesterase family protein n=1 Tax=Roseobacter sp. TaxID=1907202 RepID=UPI0032979DB5